MEYVGAVEYTIQKVANTKNLHRLKGDDKV